MPNRREFLNALGNTTAGMYLLGHGLGAAAQGGRKQIMVGGTEVRTVDIHAHCVFAEVADLIAGTTMDRQFPDWYVLGDFRLGPMDERGIDVSGVERQQLLVVRGRPGAGDADRAHPRRGHGGVVPAAS